jgi:hypothetical protein
MADIYTNGHAGPESKVRQNVAKIKQDYDDALGATIANGFFASAGYLLGGDRSAFKWSVADGVMTSFGGIPARGSRVFSSISEPEPGKYISNSSGQMGGNGTSVISKGLSNNIFRSLPIMPVGFTYMANAEQWRIEPKNIAESMLMNAAKSGLVTPIMGEGTDVKLGYPRLVGYNITKYSLNLEYTTPLGVKANAVVHYLKNNRTGGLFDFKFDDRSLGTPTMEPESKKSFYASPKK